MGRKRKGSIPQQKAPVEKREKITVFENDFNIDFFYKKWMGTTDCFYRKYNFTNRLKDIEEFETNLMQIMMEDFPKIYKDYKEIFRPGNRVGHCHVLDDSKLPLVINIIKEVHGEEISKVDFENLRSEGYDWWYLGFKQSIRIIGLYSKSNNKFLPLLIDHHHLIHDSQYYNQADYGNYDFCPVTRYAENS